MLVFELIMSKLREHRTPIQTVGASWSIEDRGMRLGFHRRAALPFGSGSKIL
jgi:hypothetical protein